MDIGGLMQIGRFSITASYLVQRIFILKLLQFFISSSRSVINLTEQLNYFLHGFYDTSEFYLKALAIGIINITELLQSAIVSQFDTGGGDYGTIEHG